MSILVLRDPFIPDAMLAGFSARCGVYDRENRFSRLKRRQFIGIDIIPDTATDSGRSALVAGTGLHAP